MTIRKGVALRTLVARMQVLYDMAQTQQPQQEQRSAGERLGKLMTDEQREALIDELAEWNRHVEVDTAHESLDYLPSGAPDRRST